MDVYTYLESHTQALIELRRAFHQIPEIGLTEYKTSAKIFAYLTQLGLKPEYMAGTGVVALLNADKDGPLFMLRSDIDALEVDEQTQLPFSSQHPGVMHACGHDGHIAVLLMAAQYLCSIKEEIPGKILFVFQPNEEKAGAYLMIEDGLFEKYPAQACAGIHIWPDIPKGKVGLSEGAVMAGLRHFHLEVLGASGHTGTPHKAKDPILGAAAIIQGVQAIQSREIDAQRPTVIMFGRVQAGTLSNVIPDRADLYGTIRYLYGTDGEERIDQRFAHYAQTIAQAYGLTCNVIWEEENLPLCNDGDMVALAKTAAQDLYAPSDMVECRTTSSEDFSEFSSRIPSVYCFVGSGTVDGTPNYPLHNCRYTVDETVLPTAVSLEVNLALSWIAAHQS